MLKRDNHFVPDSYLKSWNNEKNEVATYRLLVSHKNEDIWKNKSPKSIGFRRDFYTLQAEKGESDEIESWFETMFETPSAKARQRAINDEPLSTEDWVQIVRFLAAQDLRTPARMFNCFSRWEKLVPSLLKTAVKKAVKHHTNFKYHKPFNKVDDSLVSFAGTGRVTNIQASSCSEKAHLCAEVTIGRKLWLNQLKHSLTHTLNVLHKHKWVIIRSVQGIEWLTSDCPVVRLNFRTTEDYNFNGGWDSPGTIIFMPLSPTHLVYTQIGKQQDSHDASFFFASQIQRYTIEHAYRTVFSRVPDRQVALWRPRTVDRQLFQAEKEYWESWHFNQSEAESALLDSTPPQLKNDSPSK